MTTDRERGQVTFFGVGLVIVLLFIGGISLDLWRAFSERRALAEMADAAAAAGANAIDVDVYRQSGQLLLEPDLAQAYALASLSEQPDRRSLSGTPLIVAEPSAIEVQLTGEVGLTLLQLFAGNEPFELVVRAEAAPVRGLG